MKTRFLLFCIHDNSEIMQFSKINFILTMKIYANKCGITIYFLQKRMNDLYALECVRFIMDDSFVVHNTLGILLISFCFLHSDVYLLLLYIIE